jgi:hypothetical protein
MSSTPRNPADAQVDLLANAIAERPDAAELHFQLAEAHWRARDFAGYAAFFKRAYLVNPNLHVLPSSRADSDPMERAEEQRDRARALIGQGVGYAPVIAALAIAEAWLGNGEAVKYLMDYDRFLHHAIIDPPDGASTEAFNRALANEIKSNLKFYDSPPDRAIRHAWRFDSLHLAGTPALRALMRLLRQHVSHYMGRLPADAAHPFIASRPPELEIYGWAVVSDGASYHKSHVHPDAWATGVYYVVEPEVSRARGGDCGWLHIGPPPDLSDAANHDWKLRLIEPVPGSLVVMPAYFWHHTKPMGVDQERICVAFEIQASELARESGEPGDSATH